MPNAQAQNYALFASNEQFSALWKATRVMKAAGWRYKASSNATSKDTTGNPASDYWGGGGTVWTITVAGTIGTPTTTAKGGRVTISGVSGGSFAASSVGHYLTIAGATNGANNGTWLITNYISSSSVVIENPAAIAETTGGGASWTEVNPLTDTYPVAFQGTGAAGCWWCAEGPGTLKVPIGTASPTGTFIRGENVTQVTSGATGEFMGIVTDTSTGLGYLVIAPRASGTGAGVRGWSNSALITGSRSGATISPSATILEFVREVVFWKGSTASQGHIYYQVIESVTEGTTTTSTGRFSTMAALGTCTATICPGGASGGNPTTNGFPTIGTFVVIGSGGSGAAGTGQVAWVGYNQTVSTGWAQILCANNIEDTNVSADGTVTFAIGVPATSPTTFAGWGFHRLDDTEDGDVDPYVWFAWDASSVYARSRTSSAGYNANSGDMFYSDSIAYWNASWFYGTRRRGWATGDTFQCFQAWMLSSSASNINNPICKLLPATTDRVACAFVNTSVREPIWIASVQVNQKQRKGTLRWWYWTQGGAGTDTYDSKRWIQMSSSSGPVVVGPADGTTTPANS